MKVLVPAILIILFLFLSFQLVSFWFRKNDAAAQLANLQSGLSSSQKDLANLQSDLEYYLNPANLEKEIKGRFNYHSPGEKMIIVVPH
ncbi:MAG: septum formation initiator family protein [Patescibacteria group bacterium]|nr:septum formation initiator family protein [Patescibacteria group bacterium]